MGVRTLLMTAGCTSALLAVAVSAQARIFRTQGATASTWGAEAGGTELYHAPFLVNGSRVNCSVIRSTRDLGELRLSLPAWRGRPAGSAAPGESLAFAEVRRGAGTARLVALSDTRSRGTTIVAVEKQEPATTTVKSWPVFGEFRAEYPNSLVCGVFRNLDSGTSACVAETRDTPEQVLRYYEASLSRQGWVCLPGGSPQDGDGGLQGFAKGDAFVWVLSRKMEYDGVTRITLIHKQVAMGGR